MSPFEACFELTDCQAIKDCIQHGQPVGECDQPCVAVGTPCNNTGCPDECCDYAQCVNGTCCWSDPNASCTGDQQCCNADCVGVGQEARCGCVVELSACEYGSSDPCCGDSIITCMDAGGEPLTNLCTRECTADSECGEIPGSCCDLQTGQCRPDGECCTFAGSDIECLTSALVPCQDKALDCCGQAAGAGGPAPNCVDQVTSAASSCHGQPYAGCAGPMLDIGQAIEFADCACEQDLVNCGYLCASGSSGGGGSSSGAGGSGG